MDNAEQAVPELFVELGSERFNLVANFATFVRFDKATGKNSLDVLTWVNPTALDLVTLVWAAIGGEKSGKTVEQVADLLEGKHVEEVRKLIRGMFKKAELPADSAKSDAAA